MFDSNNELDIIAKTYKDKYESGYGVLYPEGHIIRFYERIIKHKLGIRSGNLLDFGCGNGTHCCYFLTKGFNVFGVDIVEEAINKANFSINICKETMKDIGGGEAILIDSNQSLYSIFDPDLRFDILLANQSLYYLDDINLKHYINEMYNLCNIGGICFFTMMSTNNYYFNKVERDCGNGLSRVVLDGRLVETSYINFVSNTSELTSLFKPFKMMYVGEYDMFNLYNYEGSGHHYIFVGIKE